MRLYVRLLIGLLRRSMRGRRNLLIENLVLLQHLAVYARQPRRARLRNEDRLFWSVVARTWSPWRTRLRLVQPDTVVRWHRAAWRRYWTWKSRGGRPGHPRTDRELRELIVRLASENPRWGAVRIVGELRALGCSVSARTMRRYRDDEPGRTVRAPLAMAPYRRVNAGAFEPERGLEAPQGVAWLTALASLLDRLRALLQTPASSHACAAAIRNASAVSA